MDGQERGPDEEQPEGRKPSRRGLLKLGVGLCFGGLAGYGGQRWLAEPEPRPVGPAPEELVIPARDLPGVGEGLAFWFGPRPALLIRHGERDYVCLDAECTHRWCTVQFEPEQDRIHCPCHHGMYDPRSGDRVSGPPQDPLRRYPVELREDAVVIRRA